MDIGDGTTEYIYTINQKPVLGNCTGERQGIGHALEKACKLLNKNVIQIIIGINLLKLFFMIIKIKKMRKVSCMKRDMKNLNLLLKVLKKNTMKKRQVKRKLLQCMVVVVLDYERSSIIKY